MAVEKYLGVIHSSKWNLPEENKNRLIYILQVKNGIKISEKDNMEEPELSNHNSILHTLFN